MTAIEILDRHLRRELGSSHCLDDEIAELEKQIVERRAALAANELAIADLTAAITMLHNGDLK